ncbi:prepilin-type N-terminal cleavage/methylation domain-containing protein [Rhodopirellula bahusiensis]|uniref:Type IV pilin-like protein n=1 Tax=Rhodopirellula bahusiensis TaxID=2014065 RepID=A0A2G1W836_9BACT|nr:prepilin-type N-terminal cleavage/methylation domain-containing protein [Rhodopirellula bahusiensis]PHQ35192.1 type IV pilin-like protein [Rhodopirellula bahusiensis]
MCKPLTALQSIRSALTLIELLVVLTVIGICVSLLIPALQSARGASRRTECASNIRQWHFDFPASPDRIRVNYCPDDPSAYGFFRNQMASKPLAHQATSQTFQFFEHAGGSERPLYDRSYHPEPASDPEVWFSDLHLSNGTTQREVRRFIDYERHIGGTANYLYLDGHVETLDAAVIEAWITEGHNFADVGNATPPR